MLHNVDSEISGLLRRESSRERRTINLIASENYISRAIREAVGSLLTNKYAEGYPQKRYYGGCGFVDEVESLARERAMRLFGADHANVQPHSGSQANMAVYLSSIRPGDTLMGMNLSSGGHLTHGAHVSFSGMFYKSLSYSVNRDTGLLDYDEIAKLAREHRPHMIVCGASSYPRKIDFSRFAEIAKETGALLCADVAHIAGLIAAGLHPSPVGCAHFVTSTTHKTMRGPRGGFLLCNAEYAEKVDKALFPGIQGGPLLHVIAAKAVAFYLAEKESFRQYQQKILLNARRLSEELALRGFSLLTGGTENHLMLIDLRNKSITGNKAQDLLEKAGIVTNRNAIPFDPLPPGVTSGIRLGTPAVTTRGMQQEDMATIASFIEEAFASSDSEKKLKQLHTRVARFASSFPLYSDETT